MKKFFSLIVIFFLSVSIGGAVVDFTGDVNEFAKNNPDGKKYDFMRRYIDTLSYFELNEKLNKQFVELNLLTAKPEKVKTYLDALINANANLRVARNYLARYEKSENGLILKIVYDFKKACDVLIENNNQERLLVDKIYQAEIQKKKKADIDPADFMLKMSQLAAQRRDGLSQILGASVLASKVLISNKLDKFGSLYALGITATERKALLSQLSKFTGEAFRGEIREGQSFFQASIAAINAILEDESWGCLPEKK
ncbi:MAG: hypothetical protein HQL25_03190 [Candidatus Omnitrophica bacterium]|nr:hypothetical protein [Candidatus Omnitrophota bacterium]